jgi:hypothetical protein
VDEEKLEVAFTAGEDMGLPLVRGEWAHEGGLQCYPEIIQVRLWSRRTPFELVEEATGDGYHHFLASKPA